MPHILVVEDDPQVRSALLRALGEREYVTSSAGTGMGGLEAAIRDRPDLVVVDLGLPDVDGHEVLRMLRAVSTVPVIVATAREDESECCARLTSALDLRQALSGALPGNDPGGRSVEVDRGTQPGGRPAVRCDPTAFDPRCAHRDLRG